MRWCAACCCPDSTVMRTSGSVRHGCIVGADHVSPPAAGCWTTCLQQQDYTTTPVVLSLRISAPSRTDQTAGVTRDALLRDVQALPGPGADVALLYFAGHGAGEGNDVALCTHDGTAMTPGVPLSQILGYVQPSSVREVIVVLDCCFSGAAGGVPQLGPDLAVLRNGVTILAASRGDQTSAETAAGRGLFSTYLCGGLEGGAADGMGKVTMAGLYAYLDESVGPWDQRPVLRGSASREFFGGAGRG